MTLPLENPDFPLSMWRFIIEEIRRQDASAGNGFFERFFQGPDRIWQDTDRHIARIPQLWDVINVDERFLPFLKAIVGWTETGTYKLITDAIDAPTLRRLIAASGSLWRQRGPESTILDVLQLVTAARCRLWSWFDFRWVLDETGLGELHEGTDSWLIDLPSTLLDPGPPAVWATDERMSNLRIVDAGDLDRDLVKRLLRVMRPAGERYEITYLAFLDLFSIPGDDTQWNVSAGLGLVVADGRMQLTDATVAQGTYAIVPTAESWAQYVVAAKLRGRSDASGARFGLVFYRTDQDNYYEVVLDAYAQDLRLRRVIAGAVTNIVTVALGTVPFSLEEDTWYTVRVSVVREGGTTNRIVVFVDGDQLISTTSTQLTGGGVGFRHDAQATIEVDDVEVLLLPSTTELLDINDNT